MGQSIFVFGSNLAGRHGKGSAARAAAEYGAERGVGEGRTGRAYAIPTKDAKLNVLPYNTIAGAVSRFIAYARAHPELTFEVVAVGTGLAGHKHEDMAALFLMVPKNCRLPEKWANLHAAKVKQ